jgi:hypothetical protein
MLSLNLTIARMSLLTCAGICVGQDATLRDSGTAGLAAVATNADANYCFARVRGLDPTRQPASYIELQLRVRVSYRNAGSRPLILPLERERTIYTGLKPEGMRVLREDENLFEPTVKAMKELPAEVSRENPVSPRNDVFTVIPAGGEMTPPLSEEMTVPVNRIGLFRRYPDLRGHRVYIKLQFAHRELSAALKADLSDRWSPFGVPWTGTLTTNTFAVDVPATPPAVAACIDRQPAHPVSSRDQNVRSGK